MFGFDTIWINETNVLVDSTKFHMSVSKITNPRAVRKTNLSALLRMRTWSKKLHSSRSQNKYE